MPSPPTTSSRPRSPTASGASCGRRARPSSACRSTSRRPSRRSTRRSSRVPSRPTRCRSSSARRWPPSSPGGTAIGFLGLRISNIMAPSDYAAFPSWQDDPQVRRWNLWGYVDARDVAQAVRLGLEADIERLGDRDHRGRRHDDAPAERGPDGRGLPGRPAAPPGRGPRHAPRDRSCATAARL